jgi:hypothetical protein
MLEFTALNLPNDTKDHIKYSPALSMTVWTYFRCMQEHDSVKERMEILWFPKTTLLVGSEKEYMT